MRKVWAVIGATFLFSIVAIGARPFGLLKDLQRSAARDEKHSVDVQHLVRDYLLHVPAEMPGNRPAPLVVVFHGGGGHGWNMPGFTRFDELADEQGKENVKGRQPRNSSKNERRRLWQGRCGHGQKRPSTIG